MSDLYTVIRWVETSPDTQLRQGRRLELVRRKADGLCAVVTVDNGQVRQGSRQYAPYGDRAISYVVRTWMTEGRARAQLSAALAPDPEEEAIRAEGWARMVAAGA